MGFRDELLVGDSGENEAAGTWRQALENELLELRQAGFGRKWNCERGRKA